MLSTPLYINNKLDRVPTKSPLLRYDKIIISSVTVSLPYQLPLSSTNKLSSCLPFVSLGPTRGFTKTLTKVEVTSI